MMMRTAETDATYPQVFYSNEYPEVSRSHLPEVLKPTDDYPEVYGTPISPFDPAPERNGAQYVQTQRSRLCGLQRRTGIITCIIATFMILGVALGVGLGVTTNRGTSVATSATPIDKPQPDDANRPAPFSKLAATNFTDDYQYENQFLFFQVPDGSIRMATQNSSNTDWIITNISDVLKRDPAEIAKGTSITANLGRFSGGNGLILCWLSSKPEVTCHTWDTPSTTPDSLQDSNALYTAWELDLSPALFSGTPNSPALNSSIAIYTRACDSCDRTTTLLWQSQDNAIRGAYKNGPTWEPMSGSLDKEDQTSPGFWTTVPIFQDSRNATAVNLYLATGGKTPSIWARLDGTRPGTVASISKYGTGVKMDQVSSIASWSRSYTDPRADNVTEAITVVNPLLVAGMADIGSTESRNTVKMQYYSETARVKTWHVENDAIEDLKPCWEYGMVAATMSARVFCLVAAGSRTAAGPGIAEFRWSGDVEKGYGTYLSFESFGRVV